VTRALLSVTAGAVALVATRSLLRASVPRFPLRRRNYRGLAVATGMGITVIAGLLAGAAVTALLYTLAPASMTLRAAALNAPPLLALALGFGMLGLFDDLSEDSVRGFRGHLAAARSGRATGGVFKLLAGAALAVAIAATESTSLGWTVLQGAIIALSANVFNGLDLRPGRAGKAFFLAGVPLAVLAPAASVTLAAGLGAVTGFIPEDLRERAMLGDAGANALGALIGGAIVFSDPPSWFRYGLLVGLIGLTVLAERPGYSKAIDAVPPLRAIDRTGRVQETG
jgi:UDP-N-acetylmuramyl pentapeptide phosphotransferase/UDP-N-acetylglucosamine-1-phosphate transferase